MERTSDFGMTSASSRNLFCVACAVIAVSFLPVLGWSAPQSVEEALPLVGTGGHGHTYPGVTVPFGFVQRSPDTRTKGWDACAGCYYADKFILGGALLPPLPGHIADVAGLQTSFIVPLLAYTYVGFYGWKGHKIGRIRQGQA